MKLSDTALIVLGNAAQRDDRLVPRRAKAPPVVDVNICRALVKQGLVAMVRMPPLATDLVTVREDDNPMAFLITDTGFRALDLDPPGARSDNAATDAPTEPHGPTDEVAAQKAADAPDAAPVAPATVAQVMEATGWASHTVRGFFAGLKKKGVDVAVLERVKLTNPGKEGAKGSYSVYHVAPATVPAAASSVPSRALTDRSIPTPQGSASWTHTTVARLLARVET